jgi:hypothetical protein
MPRAPRVEPEEALARAVLDRYLPVRRGRSFRIETWNHALPWARALVVAAARRGIEPTLVLHDEEAFFSTLAALGPTPATRGARPRPPRAEDVVTLEGPEAFDRMDGLAQRDRDRVGEAMRQRLIVPRGRVLRLRVADATPTAAARLGIDLDRWRIQLVRSSLVDPARLRAAGRRLERRRARRRRVRVRHSNGTDLTLELVRGPASIETGVPTRGRPSAVPDGVWRLGIAPGTVEGVFETNRPTYDRLAASPASVRARLELRAGRVSAFEADRADQALAAYARSARGRVRPLFLEVGLNPEIDAVPELMDRAAGTVSIVVGDVPQRPGRLPHFLFPASIAGADVEVDGAAWIHGGALPSGGRATT